VTRATKDEQEAKVWKIIQDTQTDLVVLARYMQVLSEDFGQAVRPLHQHPSLVPAGLQGRQALPSGP
jgi:formyltetrahydrofolate deformylase